jgi:hypothetical protein
MADTKRYLIHSHLKVEDKLTLGFLVLTFRQAAILLVGAGLTYTLWHDVPDALWVIRLALAAFIMFTAAALAFVRKQGRNLDVWLFIWARYVGQPKHYAWRRLSDPALLPSALTHLPKPSEPHEGEEEEV